MPIIVARRIVHAPISVYAVVIIAIGWMAIASDFPPGKNNLLGFADGFRPAPQLRSRMIRHPPTTDDDVSFFWSSDGDATFGPKRRPSLSLCCSAVDVDAAAAAARGGSSTSTSTGGGQQQPPPQQQQAKEETPFVWLEDAKNNGMATASKQISLPKNVRIIRPAAEKISTYGDLPWSQTQEWALRDNVVKYAIPRLVVVHDDGDGARDGGSGTTSTRKRLVRWRTLVDSTPELAGYPVDFVLSRCEETLLAKGDDDDGDTEDSTSSSSTTLIGWSTQLLPYIDRFRFESNGGLSGNAFGLKGVQDGTRIRTDPVVNVEDSIPWGYVVTADGSVVYELGEPESEPESNTITMDDVTVDKVKTTTTTTTLLTSMSNGLASRATTNGALVNNNNDNNNALLDPELIQLAGLTAVVLTGAWAMQTLSHHLTVNIFWV
jgi:hypothetical protein